MSDRKQHWRRVVSIVRPHRFVLAGVALISLANGFIEAGFLVLVTQTALAVSQDEDLISLSQFELDVGHALVLAGVLVIVRAMLAGVLVQIITRLSMRVSVELKRRLAVSFLRASWSVQQSEPTGRLQQLVSGFAATAAGVASSFITMITAGLSLTALLAAALIVSPAATLAAVAALLVLGSTLAPLRRAIRRRSREAAATNLEASARITEFGSLGLEMQTYGVRNEFIDRLEEAVVRDASMERRFQVLRASIAPTYTSLGYLALVGGLGVAAAAGGGDLAAVGAVMLVMLRSLGYGQSLQVASANVVSAGPFLEVVEETLARYDSNLAQSGSERLDSLAGLVAEGVSFSYDESVEALSGVSFRIEQGEHVGVVGPSGSGKSTLVQLLLGLRAPTAGRLTVGGIDLSDVDRASLAPLAAFVAQDAQLFGGTIAENIAFFRPHISRHDIELAAEAARLGPDLERLEMGLDTDVGERGSRLSGGQRQRVSIARALAGRPQLLVLDEPTSALDVQSEAVIRETIASLRGEITVVVIAHRMSTLEACDRVMVIQEGRLRAFAPASELEIESDFYRDAVSLSNMT